MPRLDRRQFVSAALLGATLGATSTRAARALPPRYRVADLGDLGGPMISVHALNDHGVATGMATRHGRRQPGRGLRRGERPHARDALHRPGQPSEGMAINNLGVVAGFDRGTIVPEGPTRAWYAARDGVRHYITPLAGATYTHAFGINDAGAVVGHSGWTPFVHANGQTQPLGLPPGYAEGEAHAINEAGDIVGLLAGQAGWHAFVCFDGALQPLAIPGAQMHTATAVNRHRQVCGSLRTAERAPGRAFLWQDGVAQELGSLGDETTPSQALGLNDAGIVVGGAARLFDGKRRQRAFVAANGTMRDLNDFLDPADAAVWTLNLATAINQHGQIVGQGRLNGVERAFLATPVDG
jgi:probable HAF family extracellular repeat protein